VEHKIVNIWPFGWGGARILFKYFLSHASAAQIMPSTDLSRLDKDSRYRLFDHLVHCDMSAKGNKTSTLYGLYQLRATNSAYKELVGDYLSNGLLRRQRISDYPYRRYVYIGSQCKIIRDRTYYRYDLYQMLINDACGVGNVHFLTEISPKWFPGDSLKNTARYNVNGYLCEKVLRSGIDGYCAMTPLLIKLLPKAVWQEQAVKAITYYFTSTRIKALTTELLHELVDLIHDDDQFQWLLDRLPIKKWALEHEDQEIITLCDSLQTSTLSV
jgi:hypothetical protein